MNARCVLNRELAVRRVTNDEGARQAARLEIRDVRVERALARARFDLDRGGLAERRLLNQEIDVGHGAAEDRYTLPTASRQDEVDHNLEIRPVRLGDHALAETIAVFGPSRKVGEIDQPGPSRPAHARTVVDAESGFIVLTAEYDAKRTLNTTQAGQQYDDAGQLVWVAR